MDNQNLQLGVIADDLTGAAKVASLLETAGVRCPLLTSEASVDQLQGDEQAVVIGRQLLALPAAEAVEEATNTARALLEVGAKQIYYKYSALFSSTSKGNIGPVAEALKQLTGAGWVLFCPARPARNATVYQGRLFLGNQMLHETPRRNDPLTPMTNSNLVEVLQSQSQMKVGSLPLSVLRSGKEECVRFLSEQYQLEEQFFIADAVEESDLARISELVTDAPLVTGSDDLPVALAQDWRITQHQDAKRQFLPAAPGHIALVSGSCTPKSVRQLSHFERHFPVFRIDLLQLVNNPELVQSASDWASKRIEEGPIGIATTTSHEQVKQTQGVLGREGASKLAEDCISQISKNLYALGVRKFLVAGGETSGQVLESLGVGRLDVAIHDELLGGYTHMAGEDAMSFVLKAGASGEVDFYDKALDRLKHADSLSQ